MKKGDERIIILVIDTLREMVHYNSSEDKYFAFKPR